MDTIFALSSGQPPAGIAVVRISGPEAQAALQDISGAAVPEPRRASLRHLRDAEGGLLDTALVLWFPGPGSVTGEDLAELHLHGGRAVVAAVKLALARRPGMREAQPGEFTRRGFANGRIDLSEAEGLADLLLAETELQRRSALAMADGALSRQVARWRDDALVYAAQIEAVLDFADEEDVALLPEDFLVSLMGLADELQGWLIRPRAESLREGFRVTLAGPPNAGKSTLLNALVEREAAITSTIAGTTRDVLACPVAIGGVPFTFVDTAGLRTLAQDPIEQIGIERARAEVDRADLVLWLGPEGEGPGGAWEIEAQSDRVDHIRKNTPHHRVSALTGDGIDALKRALVAHAQEALPAPGDAALNNRQHALLAESESALRHAASESDPLLAAECLRLVRQAFDRLIGRAGTEDMLDALFGRFCIGK